jgi:hypothetical protein
MALSHVFEQYLLYMSGVSLTTSVFVVCLESIASVVVFVWLLYRFTRRVAKAWDVKVNFGNNVMVDIPFTYGRALSFCLTVLMLVGIFVGVANTLFVDAIGFDIYRGAQIDLLSDFVNFTSVLAENESVGSSEVIAEQIEILEAMERPSIFGNIFAHMSTYMLYGGVVSLVIAAVARRNAKKESAL